MRILWKYLKPQQWLIIFSLALAGISQLLSLVDPLIFGKIIDDYAVKPVSRAEEDLVSGVLFWLGLAIAVALLARLTKAFQEHVTRLAVQKFGLQIFNDGLKQTLRLSFEEFEDQQSGETLSILQKVRTDTQMFINSFINTLFTSVVGVGFLIWYTVTKNWLLIPAFVIGILVLGSLTGLLSKKIKTTQRAINRETNKMAGVITESLHNIELVKSLGLTFPEIKRLKKHTQKIFELEAVAPEHTTNNDFMSRLARVLNRPFWFPNVPALFLKLIFGKMSDMLLKGSRISSDRISETGYNFRFICLEDALYDLFLKKS